MQLGNGGATCTGIGFAGAQGGVAGSVFEVLTQKQRPLGASQKRLLSALLELETNHGELTFTTAHIFAQSRAMFPQLAGVEGNRRPDARTRVLQLLANRGLVDQSRPGYAGLTAAGRKYALRLFPRRSKKNQMNTSADAGPLERRQHLQNEPH